MSFSFKGKPDQRCKGQSSLYDHLLVLGPLTDRQIEEYERQGKYGTERQKLAQERVARKLTEAKDKVIRAKRREQLNIQRKLMINDLL